LDSFRKIRGRRRKVKDMSFIPLRSGLEEARMSQRDGIVRHRICLQGRAQEATSRSDQAGLSFF